jgi:hypothetical protein
MQRSIEQLRKITGGETDGVIAHMQQLAAHPDQSRRYFAVGFRDAAVRAVFPAYGDPLSFEQQIVAGQNRIDDEGQSLGRTNSIDVLHPPDKRTTIL